MDISHACHEPAVMSSWYMSTSCSACIITSCRHINHAPAVHNVLVSSILNVIRLASWLANQRCLDSFPDYSCACLYVYVPQYGPKRETDTQGGPSAKALMGRSRYYACMEVLYNEIMYSSPRVHIYAHMHMHIHKSTLTANPKHALAGVLSFLLKCSRAQEARVCMECFD
jgi:hypothetical protein